MTPQRPSQPPYVIGAEIASGGMARVHVGRRVGAAGFSRVVAIKRLHRHLCRDDEMVRMLVDEAHLAARVRHPNVVPVLDTFVDDGELCLVMEYVEGSALVELAPLKKGAPRVPASVAIAIVVDALTGLHAAHEAVGDDGKPLGLVHRDVSPHNVLVGVDGVARVTDFGVAKAAGRLTETKQGGLKGKVAYMAPEQIAGGAIDRAVDVWAAGVVLWELLTGRRLFRGDNEAVILEQVRVAMIDPPGRLAPELPQALDDLVLRALDPDPAARPRTALELATALLGVMPRASAEEVGAWVRSRASTSIDARAKSVAEIPTSTPRATAAPHVEADATPPATSTRRRWLVAVGLLAMLTLLGFGAAEALSEPGSSRDRPVRDRPASRRASEPSSSADLSAAAPSSSSVGSASTLPSTRPSTAPPRPLATPQPIKTAVPGKPARDCDPPFTIDSIGRRIYKRECL